MSDWEAFWATSGTATRPELIRPLPGVRLNRSEAVEIEARVDAPLTTIKHVDFYANGVRIGTVTAQPYVISWRPQAVGPAELKVLVTDTLHADIPARPVFVTVE